MKKETTKNSELLQLKKQYFSVSRKKRGLLFGLVGILFLAILWSLNVGPSSANLHTVFRVLGDLGGHDPSISVGERVIVMNVRLPRIAASILVGILLSNSGLLMQGIFQNPLISPYTMGVSNGASFGASLAIVFSANFAFLNMGNYLISFFAFLFAALTMLLVQTIGKLAKNTSQSMLLAGVAIGYLFSAMVSFLKYISDEKKLPELVFWQMGDVSSTDWNEILIMLLVVVIGLIVMAVHAWDLNAMATGEESAISLGVNYRHIRKIAFVISTLMTGVAVAFTGIIGFVGMIAPHVARMLVGNDYRYTIPTASLCGAILLLAADSISRTVVTKVSLPIGVVTSFIGVPFFLWLIVKKRQEI